MSENHYKHRWHTFKDKDMLMCDSCDTVKSLKDVLIDHEKDVALRTKVQVLTSQLYARELKKSAHDTAYHWVVQNAPPINEPVRAEQGVLI